MSVCRSLSRRVARSSKPEQSDAATTRPTQVLEQIASIKSVTHLTSCCKRATEPCALPTRLDTLTHHTVRFRSPSAENTHDKKTRRVLRNNQCIYLGFVRHKVSIACCMDVRLRVSEFIIGLADILFISATRLRLLASVCFLFVGC